MQRRPKKRGLRKRSTGVSWKQDQLQSGKPDDGDVTIDSPNQPGVSPYLEAITEQTYYEQARGLLDYLGRATGCSVWLPSDDRGQTLGIQLPCAQPTQYYPGLHLSQEAIRYFKQLDVVWINQAMPVCAFALGTLTSIASALLRLSDLVAVVPLSNTRIYFVIPGENRGQALEELKRPTFTRMELGNFCQVVGIEDLQSLLEKIRLIKGRILYTILDEVAVSPSRP